MTKTFLTPIVLPSAVELDLTSTGHPFQIGSDDSKHLAMDTDEIVVRGGRSYFGGGATADYIYSLDAPDLTPVPPCTWVASVRAPATWTDATARPIINQWLAGQLSWNWYLQSGQILMGVSQDGTNALYAAVGNVTDLAPLGSLDGREMVLSVTFTPVDASNMSYQGRVSLDGGNSWQMVTPPRNLAYGSFFDSTYRIATFAHFSRVYWAEMRSGTDPFGGTVIWRFDANNGGPNSLYHNTYPVDTNADGIADGLQGYLAGSSTGTRSMVSGRQRYTSACTGVNGFYGVSTPTTVGTPVGPITPGQTYQMSATLAGSQGASVSVQVYLSWLNSSGGFVAGGAATTITNLSGTPTLYYTPIITAPAGAAYAQLILRSGVTSGTPDGSAPYQSTVDIYDADLWRVDYTDPRGKNWVQLKPNIIVKAPTTPLQIQPQGAPTTVGGSLTLAADPAAALDAATKQYVDRFVPLAGGHMTGALLIDQSGTVTSLDPAQVGSFRIGGVSPAPVNMIFDGYRIQARDGAGTHWPLSLNPLGNRVRIGEAANGGGLDIHGSTASPLMLTLKMSGTAIGYLAGQGASAPYGMRLYVDSAQGDLTLGVDSATGVIKFNGPSEWARIDASGNLIVGKALAAITNPGVTITNKAMGGNPGVQTCTDQNSANFIANHVGAADADAIDFCSFRRNNAVIGSIDQNSTTGVRYNTTSDYRLKDMVGRIDNGRARVERLRPYRVVWKDDPNQNEVDGMMAHEVAAVVPEAVTGQKDAVDDDGGIVAQQMDASRLIPVLVAAVQELSAEVRSLRAELEDLKGAA